MPRAAAVTPLSCRRRPCAWVWCLLALLLALRLSLEVTLNTCPGAEWSILCRGCCEEGRIECLCPGTGDPTGYSVPCCRNDEDVCDPCIIHPGCSIYENCRTCLNGSWGTFDTFYVKGDYCGVCGDGWSGGNCMQCGGVINGTKGTISLQGYPTNAHCEWVINVRPGHVVELRFAMLSLEHDYSCQYDVLEVRDGDNVDSPVIGRFCGNNRPAPTRSSGSSLHLLFQADGFKSFDGFSAVFSEAAKSRACLSSPCQNDGTCVLDNSTLFKCFCLAGYTGSFCERVVMCGRPKLPRNLKIEGEDFGLGDQVFFSCDGGFVLQGNISAMCQLDGTWDIPIPSCVEEEKFCPEPRLPRNGQVDRNTSAPAEERATGGTGGAGGYRAGSTVHVVCRPPYVRQGRGGELTCGANGAWTGRPAACVKACRLPHVPPPMTFVLMKPRPTKQRTTPVQRVLFPKKGAKKVALEPEAAAGAPAAAASAGANESALAPGFYPVHARLEFRCPAAWYQQTGSARRTCLRTGRWSGQAARCVPVCGRADGWNISGTPWPWKAAVYRQVRPPTGGGQNTNSSSGVGGNNGGSGGRGSAGGGVGAGAGARADGAWLLVCAAALVSERSLVSTAHCVTHFGTSTPLKRTDVRVVLGGGHGGDGKAEQIAKVSNILVHRAYDPVLLDGDLAVIRLSGSADLSDRVQPVCLPPDRLSTAATPAAPSSFPSSGAAFVSGWRLSSNGSGPARDAGRPLSAQISIMGTAQCERELEARGAAVPVTARMFCAPALPVGSGEASWCPAETGGIAATATRGAGGRPGGLWHLLGLVSWGHSGGCQGSAGLPTGYTNVSAFTDWLRKVIK
ncbi:inactive serine protease PAMR1 [Lampetra planeri]